MSDRIGLDPDDLERELELEDEEDEKEWLKDLPYYIANGIYTRGIIDPKSKSFISDLEKGLEWGLYSLEDIQKSIEEYGRQVKHEIKYKLRTNYYMPRILENLEWNLEKTIGPNKILSLMQKFGHWITERKISKNYENDLAMIKRYQEIHNRLASTVS